MTPTGVAPRSSARWLASWIVRPSMIGSENGMPTSTASAPPSTTARTTSHHSRPSPPVTYGTRSLRFSPRRLRRCVSRFTGADSLEFTEAFGDLGGVLVASARQRDEHGRALRDLVAGGVCQPADRVSRFERRDDAFGRGQQLEPFERDVVGRGVVLRT